MERKTKIEIALAILVILLLIGLVVWWKWPAAQTQTSGTASTSSSITTSTDKTTSTGSTTADVEEEPVVVKETSPSTVARTFVERLGSYSTEADAENIEDILPMATSSFQNELEALVREARATSDGAYYGVSTIVVTAPKTVSSTATQVVLSMTTQREETIDTPGNTTVSYQSITITLVKSGTTWLVNDYSWSEKM
jgi:predicted lipid-binding transport protein (Tim44 family)